MSTIRCITSRQKTKEIPVGPSPPLPTPSQISFRICCTAKLSMNQEHKIEFDNQNFEAHLTYSMHAHIYLCLFTQWMRMQLHQKLKLYIYSSTLRFYHKAIFLNFFDKLRSTWQELIRCENVYIYLILEIYRCYIWSLL